MFSYLILPKCVRSVFQDLEGKRDINIRARKNYMLEAGILSFCGIGFISVLLFLNLVSNGWNPIIVIPPLLLIFFILSKLFSLYIWRRYYAPYLEGEEVFGVVEKVFHGGMARKHCFIRNKTDGVIDKIVVQNNSPDWDLIKKGGPLNYIRGDNGFSVVSSAESLGYYCLKKSKIDIIINGQAGS